MFHKTLSWVRGFLDRNLPVIIIIAAIVGPAWVTTSFERQRLQLTCADYRIEVAAYERDRAIATELGIPVRFEPPQVPEEC